MISLHKKFRGNPQAGVTLLLTILILGTITITVFSVAAITLNEIKTSSDLGRSEPAITAAEATTEDYLYMLEQTVGSPATSCTFPSVDSTFANGVSTAACADYYFSNPYSFSLAGSGEQDFYLYDPANQNNPPGYTSVSITMNSGNAADVWLCDFSTSNCTSGSPTASLTNGSATVNFNSLDPASKYIIIIQNNAGPAVDSFTISSAPNGLPSGITTVKATATNKGVTRKIQTTVPQ